MTSESDVLKTNEFLRRRKLRLQQVREQSKHIAKKIRQRAKVEKLRQTINIDAKKEKEYFDLQDKFVERLEQLYSQSLENVGSSHKNAAETVDQVKPSNQDISKLRGKEAVAELRKRKQEKLDQQKKILDRKLHAREAANELSRDKYATVAKTLSSKSTDNIQKLSENINTEINNNPVEKDKAETDTTKNDMATQWEGDELPNEWSSSVPTLSIPKEGRDSLKQSENEKSEHKRLNLFALSDEMPSSLRGGNSIPAQASQQQSSCTLVSEYLQTRNMRLRESRPVTAKKSDDLQSIKQTILKSRASNIDGNFSNVCHVLDKQLIPVPSWTAEIDSCVCQRCHHKKPMQPVTDVFINKANSFQRSAYACPRLPAKDARKCKNKIPVSGKSDKSRTGDKVFTKKPSVTMYNHSTRDTRECHSNEPIVVREHNTEDDAYLNALKETSMANEAKTRDLDKKKEDLRNKVAMTREKVDKEYKDTLAFLNLISKEKPCGSHNASHMDYDRQQRQNDKRQKRMQEEFKKIEKDCKKTCKHKRAGSSSVQYDWMPVPESDFAVHTLPSKGPVTFSDVDTFHEYRSRLRHTPPTKQHRPVSPPSSETDSLADSRLSDAERIVIYKVLDSKRRKDRKARGTRGSREDKRAKAEDEPGDAGGVALEEVKEGIYKVGESGCFDVLSCYTSNVEMWKSGTERKPWWDNVAAAYFGSPSPAGAQAEPLEAEARQQAPSASARNSSSLRCDHACPSCKCRQPSSSCSFQTAPTEAPEGFVELVDRGPDSGKFYIGASGFLKDDNYEVVIQLKKREGDKAEPKPPGDVQDSAQPEAGDAEGAPEVDSVKESAAQTSLEPAVEAEQETRKEQPNEAKSKRMEDKDVNTTFRDEFAVPDEAPKREAPRPATSTCTQMSFGSPCSRPLFLHMTSSTSTAYLSPPDAIVPQMLRRRVLRADGLRCQHSSAPEARPPKPCRKRHGQRGSARSLRETHAPRATPDKSIDPVVKEYVNKLLALNEQGLKAMAVIDQDCSSVTTPGSSIVNATNNKAADASLDNKISLEQIKIMLERRIVDDYAKRNVIAAPDRSAQKLPKRKPVHKVKSLNISRDLFKNKQTDDSRRKMEAKHQSSPTSDGDLSTKPRSRSKSSPTERKLSNSEPTSATERRHPRLTPSSSVQTKSYDYPRRECRTSSNSTDSGKRDMRSASHSRVPPTDISTHTSGVESEINFIKSAENKLQNMDKIADLTEKCMNRLSNLAKVLEEVRRNKSLVYSHISTSDTASDSEHKQKVSVDVQVCRSSEAPFFKDDAQREYIPLLKDIPKPLTPSTLSLSTISEKSNAPSTGSDQGKHKARPPPALSRIHLKTTPDNFVVPHELSTVMEVDSPMSVQVKNQSSRHNVCQAQEPPVANEMQMQVEPNKNEANRADSSKTRSKTPSIASDDTKMEMMDMKVFNDIMLKPFVSLQEYAKQCNVPVDDGSNVEEPIRNERDAGEISSLHSEGSLPDVISELLKRKLISEPFKFDSASHLTTSMSSESSLSLLALSKMCKAKRKPNKLIANKENMAETSETLSLSSNPDLESAFQKLGMGWASSTLRKTKERLALSSSSNTSSSSYSQLKFKSFNKEPPTLATDSSLSELNDSNKSRVKSNGDGAKHALQQTSVTNSMIVKEFLTNELAKKITFNNQSNRNGDEFVSLYETKMPEEIRDTPDKTKEGDQSVVSQSNNRARTSTPVQIFRSTTYHTTSSSNTSNGLFSNAEELSSVKVTSTSIRNHSTSDKDDLTIPNYSLKRKGSDNSKSA